MISGALAPLATAKNSVSMTQVNSYELQSVKVSDKKTGEGVSAHEKDDGS
jgi:hypothetical protein